MHDNFRNSLAKYAPEKDFYFDSEIGNAFLQSIVILIRNN